MNKTEAKVFFKAVEDGYGALPADLLELTKRDEEWLPDLAALLSNYEKAYRTIQRLYQELQFVLGIDGRWG